MKSKLYNNIAKSMTKFSNTSERVKHVKSLKPQLAKTAAMVWVAEITKLTACGKRIAHLDKCLHNRPECYF